MPPVVIRDLHGEALAIPAVLALNAESVVATSPLSAPRLEAMIAAAGVAVYVPPADAFMLAFASTDDFDGGHFRWFQQRFANFLYVDRVVVAAHRRGQGLGSALYRDLFARARARGIDLVVCEVNVVPPNPVSQAFHERYGFAEVGRAELDNGAKTVRYLHRRLERPEREGE